MKNPCSGVSLLCHGGRASLQSLLDHASFHWHALQQQFSWRVWKGNVCSLVLYYRGQPWLRWFVEKATLQYDDTNISNGFRSSCLTCSMWPCKAYTSEYTPSRKGTWKCWRYECSTAQCVPWDSSDTRVCGINTDYCQTLINVLQGLFTATSHELHQHYIACWFNSMKSSIYLSISIIHPSIYIYSYRWNSHLSQPCHLDPLTVN